MSYTSQQLIDSLNSLPDMTEEYEKIAKEYEVTLEDVLSVCVDIQNNLEEMLQLYPEDNQDYIKDQVKLSHFENYIPEHLELLKLN